MPFIMSFNRWFVNMVVSCLVLCCDVTGGIDGMGLPAAMQLPGMAAFMAQRSTAAAGATGAGSGVAAEQLKAAMT